MPFFSRKPKSAGELEYKRLVEELHRWALIEFALQFVDNEVAAFNLARDPKAIEQLDVALVLCK